MRKILLLAIIALSFASCASDRACQRHKRAYMRRYVLEDKRDPRFEKSEVVKPHSPHKRDS